MTLPPGTRLGPYEITAALGAGGMGEVYRARDTTLNRDVAIKVLPADMATDPERLARLKREAQVLASLNHPNIAAIFGMEVGAPLVGALGDDQESAGTRPAPTGPTVALVMELVEGEDLSERLKRGAIPVEEAIGIAKQIALGLEEAHERGIIHRDLKPANVKVTAEGKVKILDFGLAKALEGDPATSAANSQLSHSPTMSRHMTEAGMIMGTAAYMSPEQARGKTVDKRADIWSFGVVLFEMLTGSRLFAGETVSDTLAAVLKTDPDWSQLPPETPPSMKRLLRRGLERDPRNRLHDIADARLMLDGDEGDILAVAAPPTPRGWRVKAPWLIAATAVVTALVLALPAWRRAETLPTAPVRFAVSPPGAGKAQEPVLARDGSFLVYATDRLYLRDVASFESRELPGTLNGTQPFLSPDGKWVGFFADGKIKKVGLKGGEPLVIAEVVPNSPGAVFVTNDRILFTRTWNLAPLMSVSADGGAVTAVSTLDAAARERGHWWPRPLPEGRHVLFTIWYADAGLSASRVGVLDLQTGTHRVLFPGAMAQYGAGHLLYYRAGQYHLVPFDPSAMKVTGDSQPVMPDALGLVPAGSSLDPVSLAPNGTVAYMPGELDPGLTLTWIDRHGSGTATRLAFPVMGGASDAVSLAPDDRQIAVSRPQDGMSQIWVYDLEGGEQRLPGQGSNWGPTWSQDARRVAYTSLRKGDFDIFAQTLEGEEEASVATDDDEQVNDWLPDGRMVIKRWLPDGTTSILLSRPGQEPVALVTGAFSNDGGRVSPDGRWLALCAAPSGRRFLYARSLSGGGGLQQLAAAGTDDCGARWSAPTKEIIFMRGADVVAVAYEERGERLVSARETVLATVTPGSQLYGVTRDGQRLLVGIPQHPPAATPGIRVIVNGLESLGDHAGLASATK